MHIEESIIPLAKNKLGQNLFDYRRLGHDLEFVERVTQGRPHFSAEIICPF